jgi:hypothetical protein
VLVAHPVDMEQNENQGTPHRSFRRLIKQAFCSLLTCRNCKCHEQHQKIIALLEELHAKIEIMAREMARQSKQGK